MARKKVRAVRCTCCGKREAVVINVLGVEVLGCPNCDLPHCEVCGDQVSGTPFTRAPSKCEACSEGTSAT